ncbi:tyrosine-type recombinase/integrase [Nocardioides lianchengensis]|uniref:Site-specific recombinase XerD n=1 Tax=Nocardioides lianchengensis TaxID=1045774 RepID=A0A1G6YII6_9ACTN|nr:site-specific integrase [Nocardioides lianchengensis]NYG09628.1 integrase [Nocardioides lianchengensis]SDD90188.1 Site-specific recombinase XerD [Nocardioides lianchengensis]
MTLDDYRLWLLGQGQSAKTIRDRTCLAARVLLLWGTWVVPGHVVAEFLAGYTGWSRKTYQNHLRSLYAWLSEIGAVDENPMTRIRRAPQPRAKPSPLTPDELDLAIESATPTVRAWLLLGAYAGLRCHEIAKIRGEHVTRTSISVLGKGGVQASIPTHPLLWELAETYPRRDYWFPSPFQRREYVSASMIGNTVRRHFREIGIETGSIHRTRHYFGTSLLRQGVNLRVVQELMRHADLATTANYLGVDEDEKTSAIHLLGGAA